MRKVGKIIRKFWLTLGGAILLFAGGIWLAYAHAAFLLVHATKQFGYDLILDDLEFTSLSSIRFNNASIAKNGQVFLWFQMLDLRWKWTRIWFGELEEVAVFGPNIWLKQLQEATTPAKAPTQAGGPASGFPLLIKTLVVRDAVFNLNTLSTRGVNLAIPLGQIPPLVYHDIRLGAGRKDPSLKTVQKVVLDDTMIYSPVDPMVPVLGFEKITLEFSLEGLARQELENVAVENPTIFVGEDLFWFVDQVKQDSKAAVNPKSPWVLKNYSVTGGRLTIMFEGSPRVVLPLVFETSGQDLILGDPDKMKVQAQFIIKNTNLDYPDYGVRITNMFGKLYFGLPPGQKGNENIVPTVQIDKLNWKQLEASNIHFGMTFDRTGIYAEFNGKAYKGSMEGGFAIYMEDGFPWVGWASTTGVDVGPVTKMLSPQNFVMSGPVESRIIVKGKTKLIVGMGGTVLLNKPGVVKITAVDDLLKRLPGDWAQFKQDLARIAMQAFQRYDYSQGKAEFAYSPPSSFLKMDLDGKQGKRTFDVRWLQKEADGYPVEAIQWR